MKAALLIRWVIAVCFGAMLLSVASSAHAYPWMIRHGYTGCMPCHTDPSGGAGALTEYGRAQSDLLLRMQYGRTETDEADRTAGLLWGLAPLPSQLRLGGDVREAYYVNQTQGGVLQQELITMNADLYGDIKVGRFRATGNLGYAPQGDLAASITDHPNDNLISREHWIGAELDDDAVEDVGDPHVRAVERDAVVVGDIFEIKFEAEDADGAGDGGGLGENVVAVAGNPIAAAGRVGAHGDDHRYFCFARRNPRLLPNSMWSSLIGITEVMHAV